MSTQSILSRLHKNTISIMVSLLGGLLISLQLVLPATTVAAAPDASPAGYTFGNSQAMDLASVAVVRLVVSPKASPPVIPKPCVTGLGVIASSIATSGGGSGAVQGQGPYLNTVLTDSSLLTCGANTASVSIEVLASAAYTNNTSTGEILATLSCNNTAKTCTTTTTRSSTTTFPVTCQTSGVCNQGLILLPFVTSNLQPYVPEATASSTTSFHITLGTSAGTLLSPLTNPMANLVPSSPDQQASDNAVTATATPVQSFEPGTPLVNTSGQVISIQTSSGNSVVPTFAISSSPGNQLQTAWIKAVSDFYSRNYSAVVTTDSQPFTALNPSFGAATALKSLASSRVNQGTTTTKNPAKKSSSPASLIASPIVLLSIAGLIIVVLLLLLISIAVARRRRGLAQFAKDQEAASRTAELEAQRIRMEEAARRADAQSQSVPQEQTVHSAPSPFAVSTSAQGPQTDFPQRPVDLHCPNCGYPYTMGDGFCSQCRAVLAPSESGYHVRMVQPPPQSQPPSPPVPNIQSPVLMPPPSLSEMPTLEMSPSQRSLAEETTAPAPGRAPSFNGHNISIAAGSRSDPGIKRKQKPNEDSLLAVMGERTHNSLPQQFGLFVVADGMGGHANGQDASRLAIQTMVDRILPMLSSSEDLDEQAFVQLLVNGVQQANMAVYQRNLEHHADMGTTMTSAIVVGGMAYVANVGDSRTYMYREPEGLHKITHDHSVVASLVEAGIIRNEDIYTHPKRNQIYRSLGEKPDLEIDSFTEVLQPGDKLLLCSDGLWEMVHDRDPQRDKDIQRIMSISNTDPKQTVNALINAANEGGGEDNISVIVVSVTEATSRTGLTGFHMLEKPETVQIPQL